MKRTIARHTRVGSLLAIAALGATPAGAQFNHLPAVEKNFTAGIGIQLSAHDHRAMAFGSGANVVTLLTLDDRLLRATTLWMRERPARDGSSREEPRLHDAVVDAGPRVTTRPEHPIAQVPMGVEPSLASAARRSRS